MLDILLKGAEMTPSDINGHIRTLYNIARQCTTILECGTRSATSTCAFLCGLRDGGDDGVLHSCDVVRHPNVGVIELLAKNEGISYTFHHQDDLTLDIGEVDMTFIDTWHIYGQMKRELAKFGPITKKWIVLHDTTVDAIHGESIRMKMDIPQQVIESGYPEEEIRKGIWPAVEEFVAGGTFRIKHRYSHNNGLTILERC